MNKEQIGDATLYCGDCLDLLGEVDTSYAVIADPVYGNGFDVNKKRSRTSDGLSWGAAGGKDVDPEWAHVSDDEPFDPSPWLAFDEVILWGANHYSSRLPDATKWLIWDKKCHTTPDNFSDCELAYTNLKGPVRKFEHLWRGIVRAGEENVVNGPKVHPWQKPRALMEWCVDMVSSDVVLDPFMGSGTTGVACANLGRTFIGIEKVPEYFEIACERITAAYAQGRLF